MAAAPAPGGSGSASSPGSQVPGPAGRQFQPMVVVWEWQDDLGHWRPYSGQVSGYIEQCLHVQPQLRGRRTGGPPSTSTSISLGYADPSLAPYIIDIPSMKQFRQDTGKMRCVRQTLLPQSSAVARGVTWEWANDQGGWTPYEINVSMLLENSYQSRQQGADLGQLGHNYLVDLTALAQINKATSFRRQVRRQVSAPYPPAPGPTASVIHSGPACSCQQCLANSATGPIMSRTRHSFGQAQMSRPVLHGPSRTSAPTAVQSGASYSPYPTKRPLSVGNAAWGGPWLPAASAGTFTAAAQSAVSNGLSVTSVPVQLNGPGNLNSALAGMTAILMSAAGLPVCFSRTPPQTKNHSSVRRAKKEPRKALAQKPEEVIRKYMEKIEVPPEEDCMICMERLCSPSGYDGVSGSQAIAPSAVGKFTKCGHVFHLLCMLAMYDNGTKDGSLQCPSCKTIYGEKTGTQPKGKMDIYSIPQSLPGHPDCGTIQIIYNIPPGVQGPEHPNPGQPFSSRGFPRHCYLPDSDQGRKVLKLLKLAWNRRLIFTVGTSSTTGEPDTVVWNEIHHKTEMLSNVSGHGYPDPNYLDNVLAELASQGVTEECVNGQ
ncbi:probable E3 ubiquitin-protein ligase DTX2 isoform X1 [Acipenser ruthenus]|uniref:probable E3 ubiquitin-protein ligase DTX2 isoform X1 n=1 Tax=Acipenser ruthenus TaxID=7906 RepID=UPI00145B82CA|nr:probable E3 ubiquitin-protein ligase DTX2 isoform X1 [Acipenser ruthenus]